MRADTLNNICNLLINSIHLRFLSGFLKQCACNFKKNKKIDISLSVSLITVQALLAGFLNHMQLAQTFNPTTPTFHEF